MGPLSGIKVVEIASLAPAPMGTTVLADLGADLIIIDRPGTSRAQSTGTPTRRNRRSIALDLKKPEAIDVLLKLCDDADVFVEGFRPGVTERLGLGPDELTSRNPGLVYARMTGWGQTGPMAQMAGHDINYIAISGVLHLLGPADDKPMPPANLIGDFGGGGMLMALGILAALVERQTSGRGQVVDVAMVDGAAQLANFIFGGIGAGTWSEPRGKNTLDGGAPFYQTYECADGRYVAVGAIEPQFYAAMLKGLQIDPESLPEQHDRSQWPATQKRFAEAFKSQPREHWERVFEGTDACVVPVLSPDEAFTYPANVERGVFTEIDGIKQPVGAPRFSRTVNAPPRPAPTAGQDTDAVLRQVGLNDDEVEALRGSGALG